MSPSEQQIATAVHLAFHCVPAAVSDYVANNPSKVYNRSNVIALNFRPITWSIEAIENGQRYSIIVEILRYSLATNGDIVMDVIDTLIIHRNVQQESTTLH